MNWINSNIQKTCDVYFTAGETISASNPVYVQVASGAGIAGRVYKTDSSAVSSSSNSWFVGVALNDASSSGLVKVRMEGIAPGFTNLTPGDIVYASTTGSVTHTAPTNSLQIGLALSSTTVLVNNKMTVNPTFYPVGMYKGYVAGGYTGTSGTNVIASDDLIFYSTETSTAVTTANLSSSRGGVSGLSSIDLSKGYFMGGSTGAVVATADKVNYNTDVTAASTASNLTQVRQATASISDNLGGKGYTAGGNSGAIVTTANLLTYSSDATVAWTSANLTQARQALAGVSYDLGGRGYFLGGATTATAVVTTANMTSYSSGTTAAQTSANLPAARQQITGISDTLGAKGYVAGGLSSTSTGSQITTAYKLTFSTSATAALTTANLSVKKAGISSASDNPNGKGYWLGGSSTNTTFLTTTDRISYANETTNSYTSANIITGRRLGAGISANGV